jgi:hypothetical protein
MAYQVPLMFGMVLFLYGLLEPIGLAAVAWFGVAAMLTLAAGRFLVWGHRMGRAQKSPLRSLVHSCFTTACCASLLVGLWFCPLGSAMTAPVILEPQAVRPVYVETPGTVLDVHVREGDAVQPGTLLVELENRDLDQRLVVLEGLLASHQTDVRLAQATGDPDLMTLARTAMDSTARQIEHARADKEQLLVRAGISGTLVSARPSGPASTASASEPSGGSAGILNPRLVGQHLPRRTCLCEIAPGPLWQAVLWVDQRGRQHLSPGQRVEVVLEAFPGTVVAGRIVALSAANESELPAVLSTKHGGPYDTQSGSAGEEPVEPVYQAAVNLEDLRLPVQAGMRGTGRFSRPAITVGSWLTEEFHRVFVAR